MKIIIVLLCCLGLISCTTASKEGKIGRPAAKKAAVDTRKKSAVDKGHIPVDQKELDNMISVISEAIKNKPNHAGAYYNRAVAYYYKKDYDKSWQDVHKAEELNTEFDQSLVKLVEKLRKASGRNK